MNKIKVILPMALYIITPPALAVSWGGGGTANPSCDETTCPSTGMSGLTDYTTISDPNCEQQTMDENYGELKCFKDQNNKIYGVRYCTKCRSGYSTTNSYRINPCKQTGFVMQIGFPFCDCSCSNCSNDPDYTAAGTGYEKRVLRHCECTSETPTCKESTSYRCAKGYYGNSTNGTSGCTRCPASGGVYGTTASAGATAITSCYLPEDSKGSDTTGSWTITGGKCFYTN